MLDILSQTSFGVFLLYQLCPDPKLICETQEQLYEGRPKAQLALCTVLHIGWYGTLNGRSIKTGVMLASANPPSKVQLNSLLS